MKVPLVVNERMYANETIDGWKSVWETICKMTYENDSPVSEIITAPDYAKINGLNVDMIEKEHSEYYRSQLPANSDSITMDEMWAFYSKKHGPKMPTPVPELQRLHVPRPVFQCLGIYSWFQHSFPNCKITFWEE